MQVIRAEAMGLCFGVRDALESIAAVPDPHHVTVYGELVHNQEVNRRLAERGFRQLNEHSRKQAVPETPVVLITAHGISNEERTRLESTRPPPAGHHLSPGAPGAPGRAAARCRRLPGAGDRAPGACGSAGAGGGPSPLRGGGIARRGP